MSWPVQSRGGRALGCLCSKRTTSCSIKSSFRNGRPGSLCRQARPAFLRYAEKLTYIPLSHEARAKIVENIEKLPNCTCLQTVQRFRFELAPRSARAGCGYIHGRRFWFELL